jgi:hypothetical protein
MNALPFRDASDSNQHADAPYSLALLRAAPSGHAVAAPPISVMKLRRVS